MSDNCNVSGAVNFILGKITSLCYIKIDYLVIIIGYTSQIYITDTIAAAF